MTTPRVTVPVEPEGVSPVYSAAYDSIRKGAPGLSDATCAVIARTINMKVALLSAAPAPEGGAVTMIRSLLDHIDRETCHHDNLKRGGVQWTICEDCDRKWADDQGGFKPHVDAPPVAAARLYLAALATREVAPAPCKSCNGSGMDAGSRFNRCPDCSEEAPAEAGEEDGAWIIYFEDRDRELEAFSGFGAREAAQRRYEQVTVSWNAHLFERVKSPLPSLRAQPPAREDAQPVAWRYKLDDETAQALFRPGWNFQEHKPPVQWGPYGRLITEAEPLYTHPAPDALRVAVEALVELSSVGMVGRARSIAAEALAALQQEGRDRG